MSDLMVTRFVSAPRQRDHGGWNHLTAAVKLAWRTYATRQALPDMPDHLLADVGLSRPAARAEAARLPWDVEAVQWQQAVRPSSAARRTLEGIRARRLASGPASDEVFWGG